MHVNLYPRMGLLGVSRTWDSAATYDCYTDVGPFPYPPTIASGMVAPWMDANLAALKPVTEMRAASTQFTVALKANNQYAADMRAYYDMRVNRTSGGKRDRLRDERAAVQDGIDRANKLFTAAVAQLDALAEAKAKGTLAVNPDTMTRQVNPETGEVLYNPPSRQVTPQASAKPGLSTGALMLPLAAVAAAYLALK